MEGQTRRADVLAAAGELWAQVEGRVSSRKCAGRLGRGKGAGGGVCQGRSAEGGGRVSVGWEGARGWGAACGGREARVWDTRSCLVEKGRLAGTEGRKGGTGYLGAEDAEECIVSVTR